MGTIGKTNLKPNNYLYLSTKGRGRTMDFATENRPETCSAIGLDCGNCIQRCASTTAAICPDLSATGAHRMFFQLYPSPGCHGMALAFQRAYADALSPTRTMVAVAAA
jgi:hypothetical protein